MLLKCAVYRGTDTSAHSNGSQINNTVNKLKVAEYMKLTYDSFLEPLDPFFLQLLHLLGFLFH